MTLEFIWPQLFWLLPAPLIIYWLVPRSHRQQESTLLFPALQAHQSEALMDSGERSNGPLLFLLFIWILVLCAAARPQWMGEEIEVPATGRDLLLAVDISGSMKTPDMLVAGEQVPRIEAVKDVVGDFIRRRHGDRLGLVLFGTRAYLHVPLTFDLDIVKQQLSEAQLGFAGSDTAIGDAIAISVKRLQERPNQGRILIVLTDGKNTAGELAPERAAELASMADVKIHTIGIGATSMEVRNLFWSRQVNPSAELDEDMLRYIAEQTGGQYFRAHDPAQLEAIYEQINQLEKIDQDPEIFRPTRELFFYPLLLAVFMTFLAVISNSIKGLMQHRTGANHGPVH